MVWTAERFELSLTAEVKLKSDEIIDRKRRVIRALAFGLLADVVTFRVPATSKGQEKVVDCPGSTSQISKKPIRAKGRIWL